MVPSNSFDRSTETLCCVRIQSAVSDASAGSRSAIAAGRSSEGHARGCARIQSPSSGRPAAAHRIVGSSCPDAPRW
jgi:hypothetical protein